MLCTSIKSKKERILTISKLINRAYRDVYCFTLFSNYFNCSLPLTWLNNSKVKQYFIQCDKNWYCAIVYFFIPRDDGRKRKHIVYMLKAWVLESDHQNSNSRSAISWIHKLGLCKLTSPSLSSPQVRLDNNSYYLLKCSENYIMNESMKVLCRVPELLRSTHIHHHSGRAGCHYYHD